MSRQLTLPLPWEPAMAEGSLPAAVDTVIAAWAVDGAMSEQTLDKFALLARRFARFAAAHHSPPSMVPTWIWSRNSLPPKAERATGRSVRPPWRPCTTAAQRCGPSTALPGG
ncbi:hypothetical protein BN970_03577 [Mycolicibacterium conceptionense]|uniref:Uncharacterized protein n=1 Tax=Mycolicibacterium conceptionense TaxID=451644 RepID=A0A0U1DIW1_9MYCO|nr:hypothetical protein BN970_03577 [Mycolicibacterium conceptionense]